MFSRFGTLYIQDRRATKNKQKPSQYSMEHKRNGRTTFVHTRIVTQHTRNTSGIFGHARSTKNASIAIRRSRLLIRQNRKALPQTTLKQPRHVPVAFLYFKKKATAVIPNRATFSCMQNLKTLSN